MPMVATATTVYESRDLLWSLLRMEVTRLGETYQAGVTDSQ